MLTDSEGPTAHAHYLWHCFLVKSDICTTALLSMLFIISTQGLQINQGAKWRWYLLYLFMKLPSRHRTAGRDCSGWMQTRAKYMEMLSAQIIVYPQCDKDTALKYYTPWYTPCIHCPSHLLSRFILWTTLDLCILKNHPFCLGGYCPILGFTRLILKNFGTVVESHISSPICVMTIYLTLCHEIHGGALMGTLGPWEG